MSKGRVMSRLKQYARTEMVRELDIATLEAVMDIHRRADMLAPQDSGNLKSSGHIKRRGVADYSVTYGGTAGGFEVPYAKRRHYENQKNPQTLLYLERAGDSVRRTGIAKYVKGGK